MNQADMPFHLLVFFTFNVSLKKWVDSGLIGRELLLYKRMVRDGNRVTLLTYGGVEDYQYRDKLDGIELVPVYAHIKKSRNVWVNLVKSFSVPFRFKRLIRSADFLKTNQMTGAWVPMIAGKIFKRPLVVRCGFEKLRNWLRDEKKPTIWLIKAVLGYVLELLAYTAAKIIIISNVADRDFIQRVYPVRRDKIRIIRNFIDTAYFVPKNPVFSRDENTRLLFVGSLENHKNLENLIKAVHTASCSLDIVGKGNKRRYLEQLAEKLGAKVEFMGTFDNRELPEIIGFHDLFILCSYYEGNPKTLLEAMSCARIVIGSDVEGIRELIKDGVTGFLCNANEASIEETIRRVWNTDESVLSQIASNARDFVIRECSLDKVYRQEMEVYGRSVS